MKIQNKTNESAQDLLNEIERGEIKQENFKEWAFKKFYPELWNHRQADLNLSLVVGK